MKTPEHVRSKARRLAGARLERKHPLITSQLRKLYNDSSSLLEMYGNHFNARRVEWIRSDVASKYPKEYKILLKEALHELRTN